MKVVAVVGSESGAGKTTLVCRLLRERQGLGAVKISPRDVSPRIEWGPGDLGSTKDTARYAASGAARIARIIAPRDCVSSLWDDLLAGMRGCKAIVIEGSSALSLGDDRMGILVVRDPRQLSNPKDIGAVLQKIDIIVENNSTIDRPGGQIVIPPSHLSKKKIVIRCNLEKEEDQGFIHLLSMFREYIDS